MEKFKWGIIGPGRIAEKFAKAVNGLSDMEIHAVASISLSRAESFAKEHGILKYYGNYDNGIVKDFPFSHEINGFEYEIKEFVRLVKNSMKESPDVSLSRSRKVCEIMEMAYNKICNS